MIPFNRASFDGHELEYLTEAVRGGHVSGNGPFTKRAESLLDQAQGTGRTLLTTSCTHALELAAALLELTPGDEVVVPAYSFVSCAAAFATRGAVPRFVDVREDTLNLCPTLTEAAIGPRTRAICLVHYAGVGAAPAQFVDLAKRYGLRLIEDNAHGLGGTYRDRLLGTFGDLTTLSFHETKNVTCGEGGALQVNSIELLERAEILREKGTDRSRFLRGQVEKYTWVDIGSSWVLSDLLAGVLVGQLERFDSIQARRATIWERYDEELADWARRNGVRAPSIPSECTHTSHLYHLRMDTRGTRDRFIRHLRERGVLAVFHYQPLHLSAMGTRFGGRPGQHPVSEDAGDTLVRLPLFTALSDHEIDQVIDAVRSFSA